MKKEWKNIEGKLARIDVGSSFSEAMGGTFPAEAICFTTDGNIVFNGIQYSLSQDEYNAIMATIATKVDKKECYDLASQDQLYAATWCIKHILQDDDSSTSFLYVKEDGKNGYKLTHLVDGETYNSVPQYIPLATDTTSGIMSAADHADFTTAKEDIDALFAASEKTDNNVAANAANIATNATNIAANAAAAKTAQSTADSALSRANSNAAEITRRASTMVLPISGINALVSSAEAQGIDGAGAALGSLPAFATKLGGFVITKNLKTYLAWSGFSDIPNADSYGSTRTLYYDGTTLYRYNGSTLTDIFADHETRLAALESTLAALTAESIIIE